MNGSEDRLRRRCGRALVFGIRPQEARVELVPRHGASPDPPAGGRACDIPEALEAIRAFGSDIARLISHRLALAAIPRILLGRKPEQSLKMQAVAG